MTSGDDPNGWAAQGIEASQSNGRPERSCVAHPVRQITPEYEQEIWRFVNRFGPANCWTGDSGTAARYLFDLLIDRAGS